MSSVQNEPPEQAAVSAPPRPAAERSESPTLSERVSATLFSATSPLWIFLALVVIVAVFSVLKPSAFLSSFDIKTIFINAAVVMMLSVGMTFVIITAGIDLSVGSVLVISGVLAAKVMIAAGGGVAHAAGAGWGAILAGVAVGLIVGVAWGLINGSLIALAGLPPLIVTLGTFGMALGLADVITSGVDVAGIPTKLNSTIGSGQVGPIPWLVLIAAVVTIVCGLVLHLTRFGRYTYAIGSNPEAARRAGINVNLHLIKVYALAGLLSGLGGVLSLAYFTTTTISGHTTDNLTAIAAVVIGGTSLFGGRGTMFGTVVGVFIPVVLASGLVIMSVQSFWQQVVIGAILILAVYFDQLRRRARLRP
ncbi:MAG TPA: ABC transporter permease [Solirubrobacteraceae bacterium]|nr:ABC transporter permease [Solirubrobacteraceae bacterium]